MHEENNWEIALLPGMQGEKNFLGNDGALRKVIEVDDDEFAFWWKVGDPRQFYSPFVWGIWMVIVGAILSVLTSLYLHGKEWASPPVEGALGGMVFVASPVGLIGGLLIYGFVSYINRRTEKHIWQARKLFLVELGYRVCPEKVATPDMVSDKTSRVLVPKGVSNSSELEAYLAAHNLN